MIKKIITEMPYIKYGSNKTFDLELENFKIAKDMLDFLEKVLKGQKLKDKYGNTINLSNKKDIIDFIINLKKDSIFKNVINNLFSNNEKRLLNLIFDIAINL